MSEPAQSSHPPVRRRTHRRREGQRRLAFLVATFVMLASVALAIAVDGPASEAPVGAAAASGVADGALIVAHHGAAGDASAGLLGGALADVKADLTTRVQSFGAERGAIVPAIHLTAVRATNEPGPDGLYRTRETAETIQAYLDLARSIDAQLILDVRPGRARWIDELRYLRPFLNQPDVGVSLDPEWKTGPDGVPGQQVGEITASTINQLSRFVGELALENDLPDKLMVVHQFAPGMIVNRHGIVQRAGVRLIVDINGQGDPASKRLTYSALTAEDGAWQWGIKLFPNLEPNALTPDELRKLDPAPALVIFQ